MITLVASSPVQLKVTVCDTPDAVESEIYAYKLALPLAT
jgi:hypothetical protein